ncbi:ABC-three component system protein [Enterococcus cecorum]|nr:ABC-three component system protein [Enterococcus cecorum]CAI3511583.1 hypothetical protein CIRMBP1295_02249 [Enterococcus cecorum]CAI3512226.1 hypothetical protein CIRMBP1287_00813 [Enterococcus cecorum]
MGLIAPISAINSWEGYKYQGNIALYVTLSCIKDILSRQESLNSYDIQIEGEEDFALLKNGQYKSLHQVKLGKVNLDDNDKFAFIAEIIQNGAELGYFHVNSNKHIPSNFLEKACLVISNLKFEFQKKIISKCELTMSDDSDDYIVLEFITANNAKASKYSIIKYNTEGKNDRNSVENAIKSIRNELQYHENEIENRKQIYLAANPVDVEDRCFVEEWPIKFDNIKEVKSHGVQLIKDIVAMVHPEWTFADNKYCSFLYEQGIGLIEKYVTDYFVQGNNNKKCIISFSEFYELIVKDYYSNYNDSKEFKYFLVLKTIYEVFIKFREDNCNQNNCEKCAVSGNCNLLKQLTELSAREIEEKHSAVFNLLLHEPIESINNLPSDETIETQLVEMLKDLSTLTLNEKNIIAASFNKEFYWLSLDDSRKKEKLREKIQTGIRENSDKSFLYECDTLITGRLNDETFKIDGSNVNILERDQLEEIRDIISNNIEDEKADCNKPKIIRLVNTEQAKEELL